MFAMTVQIFQEWEMVSIKVSLSDFKSPKLHNIFLFLLL